MKFLTTKELDPVSCFCQLVKKVYKHLNKKTSFSGLFQVKEDGSPVGDLDLEIEYIVRKEIAKLLPTFDLVSEESPIPDDLSGNCIVIDPVDGTENFVSGIPIWGTGMALFVDNVLVASWVYFPELELECRSRELRQQMGIENTEFRFPEQVSRVHGYSSNSLWKEEALNFPEEVRIFGCSLFNLVLATKGAIAFRPSKKGARVWDVAPALLFALESGKKVRINGKEYHGEFLDPSCRFVVEISPT